MKVMVLNGPNLNMVGIREKDIYGEKTFEDMIVYIEEKAKEKDIEVVCLQSNHEGQLIDWLHQAYFDKYDGVIINAGAYTHTSIAIADAIKAIDPLPVVEVHLSDVDSREEFRHVSYMKPYCLAQVKGYGWDSYIKAMDLLASKKEEEEVE